MARSSISVIKVGGSLLSPDSQKIFDFDFVRKLRDVLLPGTKDEKQYVLCAGGGYLSRWYQKMLSSEGNDVGEEHNIGVATINVNAVMMASVLDELTEEGILRYADYDSEAPIVFNRPLLVAAAGSSGHSSDWNAVKLALRANSEEVISLKNIDGVYTADPQKDPKAERVDHLTWDEYVEIIGNPVEHIPGAHYPVDPLAAKLAKENCVMFKIVDGSDIINLKDLLEGKSFVGSTIE